MQSETRTPSLTDRAMSIVKSRMLRTRERARKTHGWQRGLLKRIVEFTMIVVGVLVALGGNAWWENREDARLAGTTGSALQWNCV